MAGLTNLGVFRVARWLSVSLLTAFSFANAFTAPAHGANLNWPPARQPIPVCILPGKDVPGYKPELEAVLKQAFDDWMIAAGGKIQFVFVDKTDGGQGITCQWTADRSKLVSQAEDGETTLVPDSQGISSARILLLTVPPKAMPTLTKNYARRVALHEIGHALGISTHSGNTQDIMFGTIYPEDKACALTAGDTAALLALYKPADNVKIEIEAGSIAHPEGMPAAANAGNLPTAVNLAAAVNLAGGDSARCLRLNNEAAEAMNGGKIELARTKLEEAYKIDPNNQVVAANLGLLYSNLASMAMMMRNLRQAEIYSKKSSVLVEKFGTKANLLTVLKAQGLILHMAGKEAEALKVEARLKTMAGMR